MTNSMKIIIEHKKKKKKSIWTSTEQNSTNVLFYELIKGETAVG